MTGTWAKNEMVIVEKNKKKYQCPKHGTSPKYEVHVKSYELVWTIQYMLENLTMG